jgi:hypothetical protein
MNNRQIIIAATIVGLTVLASRAGAAIIVTDGTLHAHVYADGVARSDDQAFVLPGSVAGVGISPGMGIPPGPTLSAYESVSFVDGQVEISTDTIWLPYGVPYPDVVASGNLSITEDTAETMWIRINPNPLGHGLFSLPYQGQVSLDVVGGGGGGGGGGNVFATGLFPTGNSSSRRPFDFLVPLSPGQYTLTWSATGQRDVLSSGGEGGFDFTMGVPEPSAGLLLVAPAAMTFIRRRSESRLRQSAETGP